MNETIIAKASEIIKEKGYCALAQIDVDGYPTVATISPSKMEGIKWMTFCTGRESN